MRVCGAARALVVSALVAGCADVASSGEDPPVTGGARTIEVVGESLAFRPRSIEIAAGTDVAIALSSTDVEHNLVIDGVRFAVAARRGQRRVGSLRIDNPGRYTAYCSVAGHRAAGMELTVTATA